MGFFSKWLRSRAASLSAFVIIILIFIAAFAPYRPPLTVLLYPVALALLVGAVFLTVDLIATRKRHNAFEDLSAASPGLTEALPPARTVSDEDHQRIIIGLLEQQRAIEETSDAKYRNMTDYYTVWAHQIKTPIAAMRLSLQDMDSPSARQLRNDLNRVDQYVNMVMAFLRLDSNSTDYVFREYDLDSVVRSSVKHFAGEFIARKLHLEYEPLNIKVVTDEKWLGFVIEQILSNALKYTPAGTIFIYMEGDTLCIRDTGIGIAESDLPRIFENGYTGFNGRENERASGIGLYLCKRICDNLGHTINASSVPGEGTVLRLGFHERITNV